MRNSLLLSCLIAITSAACGAEDLLPEPRSRVPTCVEPSVRKTDWQNPLTRLGVLTGDPVHVAADVVQRAGRGFELEGKFAYGPASKDLEHESVTAFLETDPDGCGWAEIGTTLTDSDGKARISVPAGTLDGAGNHRFRFVVHGDQSEVEGRIYMIADGTPAVLFDIDGTLTASDLQVAGDVVVYTVGSSSELLFELAGSPLSKSQWMLGLERVVDEPEAYPGAFDLAHHYAEQGYLPIYVTGRPYMFDAVTREWLDAHLPGGPVFLAPGLSHSMPSGVTAYKQARIEALLALGLDIQVAYGNASTDVCAYAQAGLPVGDTWIIGEHAGAACPGYGPTQPVADYPSHLEALSASPAGR